MISPEEEKTLQVYLPDPMRSLPVEVFFAILRFLSVSDVKDLRLASRFFHFLIVESNQYREYQMSLLSDKQKSDATPEEYKRVIIARHNVGKNLKKSLVPVSVGLSFFGAPPIAIPAANRFLSSITSALDSSIIKSKVPVGTKYHLSEARRDVEIDLAKVTKAIYADNAEDFIAAVSRCNILIPYVKIKGDIDKPGLLEAMAKLNEINDNLFDEDFAFIAIFLDALINARAVHCFKYTLKIFITITSLVEFDGQLAEEYKNFLDKFFGLRDSRFQYILLKSITEYGSDQVIEYILSYLIENHKASFEKKLSSNHYLFTLLFERYIRDFKGSRDVNILSRLVDFIFKTEEKYLKLKLFKLASESDSSFILCFLLERVIKEFSQIFSFLYQNKKDLFLSIFEEGFDEFVNIKVIYDFIMSLNLEEEYILEHRYNREKTILKQLISDSDVASSPVSEQLKSRIIAQMDCVNELEARLDSIREALGSDKINNRAN